MKHARIKLEALPGVRIDLFLKEAISFCYANESEALAIFNDHTLQIDQHSTYEEASAELDKLLNLSHDNN